MLALGKVAVLLALMGAVVFLELLPRMGVMKQVMHEICDGNTDFVVRQDLSKRYAVYVGQSEAGEPSGHRYRHTAVMQATRFLPCADLSRCALDRRSPVVGSHGWHLESEERIYHVADFDSVSAWAVIAAQPLDVYAETKECWDFDADNARRSPTERMAIGMAMREILELQDVPSCSSIRWACTLARQASGVSKSDLVRLACPLTCGCASSTALQLFAGSSIYGCPSNCNAMFEEQLANHESCEDQSGSVLASYIGTFKEDPWMGALDSHSQAGAPSDCAYFLSNFSDVQWSIGLVSVCNVSDSELMRKWGYRSARPLCPLSCGCKDVLASHAARLECPSACVQTK